MKCDLVDGSNLISSEIKRTRRDHSDTELLHLPAVPKSPEINQTQQKGFINQNATSPGRFLDPPTNPKARATGPRSIRLNWDPPLGNPTGYKVLHINIFKGFILNQ